MDNGQKVDIHGTDPVYRVCTSNYSATLEGSVFEGKEPVVPMLESPVDNQAIIELLRERRDSGVVHIPTDSKPRGVCLNAGEIPEDEPGETGTTESTEAETETEETTATETAEAA